MDLKSILKTVLVSFLLVIALQFKLNGETFEQKILNYSETSQIAAHIQMAAHGGAVVIKDLFFSVKKQAVRVLQSKNERGPETAQARQ